MPAYHQPFGGDGPNGVQSGDSYKNKAKPLKVRIVCDVKILAFPCLRRDKI